MLLKILLILSILLHFPATVIAIRMTRRTKFNSAWILCAVAMLIINTQLVYELIGLFNKKNISYVDFMVWSTIVVSLALSVGVFYMEKIISYIEAIERYRQMYDRKILSSVINAEEEERQRLAKDLHDGIGPLLSSAKMSLSYIAKPQIDNAIREEMIIRVESVIDEAIRSVRDISNNLSPNVLNSFGLQRAVATFIHKLPLPPDINIDFNSNIKRERFDSNMEILLYRVCLELINNAIKHSGAAVIKLNMELLKNEIRLVFEDNGKGFDYHKIKEKGSGLGLSNMESRVSLLDGQFSMDSKEGTGTKTTIVIPVKRAKKGGLWIR